MQITVYDSTAPSGSLVIAGGKNWTKTSSVTLTLSCTDSGSGCSQMQFSNDNVTYSSLESYATSKAWTLAVGDGIKTVYARYTDAAGNLSSSIGDSIKLDTTKPVVSNVSDTPDPFEPGTGQSSMIQFTLSDNLSGTCQVKVKIQNASGGQVNMLSSNVPCSTIGTASSMTWDGRDSAGTIVPNGTYTYRIQASDYAGNVSSMVSGAVGVK